MITKLLTYLLYLFLFLFPLFTPLGIVSPSETDKNALLVLFGLIFLGIYLYKFAKEPTFKIVKTPYDGYFILMISAYIISSIFISPNKTSALMNPFGTGAFVCLFILYTVIVNNTKMGLLPLSVSASLLSLIVIFTQVRLISFYPLGDLFSVLLIILPVALYLLLRIAGSDRKRTKINLIYLVLLFVNLSAVGVIVLNFLTDQKPIILPLFAGWAILLETYKNFTNLLLGVGPANFLFAYNLAKPLTVNSTVFWNLATPSSSNLALTILTEAGVIAGVSFLLILLKNLFTSQKAQIKEEYFLPFAGLCILSFLLPFTTSGLVMLFVFLALSVSGNENFEFLPQKYLKIIIVVIGLSVVTFGFYTFGKTYASDIFLRRSLYFANNNKFPEALSQARLALDLNSDSEQNYIYSSALALSFAQSLISDKNATDSAREQAQTYYKQAMNMAKWATELNPQNSSAWNQLAQSYQPFLSTQQNATQLTINALSVQNSLNPASPLVKLNLGTFFLSLGDIDSAKTQLTQAVNLKPDLNSGHYWLAQVYIALKNYQVAKSELAQTLELTPPNDKDYENLKKQLDAVTNLAEKEASAAAEKK